MLKTETMVQRACEILGEREGRFDSGEIQRMCHGFGYIHVPTKDQIWYHARKFCHHEKNSRGIVEYWLKETI